MLRIYYSFIFPKFITIFIYFLLYYIYSVDFLPSSRSPEDIFVCFSKSVLVFLTVVGFFSLIFLALGWQDGCVCSLLELSSSTSATEQHLNILMLYNISMPIVYCTNYSLILSKIFFNLHSVWSPETRNHLDQCIKMRQFISNIYSFFPKNWFNKIQIPSFFFFLNLVKTENT